MSSQKHNETRKIAVHHVDPVAVALIWAFVSAVYGLVIGLMQDGPVGAVFGIAIGGGAGFVGALILCLLINLWLQSNPVNVTISDVVSTGSFEPMEQIRFSENEAIKDGKECPKCGLMLPSAETMCPVCSSSVRE